MTPTIDTQAARVALVHDYMTQMGGAERLAGILAASMPSASLLTSVHRPDCVPLQLIGNRPWQTSFLQPLSRHVPLKAMLPLLPRAIASLDVTNCDVVISTSSAFAHHARRRSGARHVCYCSAPAHFLWNSREYFRSRPAQGRALKPLLRRLRRLDIEAAQNVDVYIANSRYTASRVHEIYGRDALVVYPPVECDRFEASQERSGRFLVVSRLVATKRIELAVEAANRLGLPLDVIGRGPELLGLKKLAGSTVRLLGWQPDSFVRRAMAESEGVIVAGEEDFGMVMAEAQASGRPPIAFAAGGALEIIEDGRTGFLFDEQTSEAIGEAMARAREYRLDAEELRASALRFDVPVFLAGMSNALNERHFERGDRKEPPELAVVSRWE